MDTITHGIAGALISKAVFGGEDMFRSAPMNRARILTWSLMLGAIFPDSDIFREWFSSNPLLVLTWHRSITHSLICLPIFALSLAALTRWFVRWRKWDAPSFASLTGMYAIGIASHILLDLVTSFGTMVWSPLRWSRPAWDLIFIIDFTFSAILLVPQILPWVYAKPEGLQKRALGCWFIFVLGTLAVGGIALAIGAPIGMALYQGYGLQAVMIACILAPLIAAVIAFREVSYTTAAGQRLSFYRVIGQIWREGLGLMLQGVGLSGLTAFASLYFAARSWGHAGLVMTAFGIGFIFARVALGSLPDRMSGYRVALWSLVIEATGQAMLWFAPYEIVALAGALVTGLGCALVFPALGVEALKRVLPANRGSAMGAFVAFLDIAYGVSGPAAGAIAVQFGYAAVYMFGAVCALLGAALVVTASQPSILNANLEAGGR